MKTTHTTQPASAPFKTLAIAAAASAALIAGVILYNNSAEAPRGRTGFELGSAIPQETRKAIYEVAAKKAENIQWPADDNALVNAFWGAICRGEYQTAVLYAPGTTTKDLQPYMAIRPTRITAVGAPTTHASVQGVTMIPVTVEFEKHPPKQLRMAVVTFPDGRRAIHGGHSEWW